LKRSSTQAIEMLLGRDAPNPESAGSKMQSCIRLKVALVLSLCMNAYFVLDKYALQQKLVERTLPWNLPSAVGDYDGRESVVSGAPLSAALVQREGNVGLVHRSVGRRKLAPRLLSSSSSSSSSSDCENSHKGAHKGHPHDALLFMFVGLIIGAAILQLSSFVKGLQQTVALFITGVIFSLVLEGLNITDGVGVFGRSYVMWMNVDPHLLLFTLLPALLAGDAMTIDTSVAKNVGYQCLYLAGPGVLVNAISVAGFLSLFMGWSFLLSLVTGSILCATDPVAVVALLKELGASPTLTIQIQGESLLNDGTAIVLYNVAYMMLSGKEMDATDMLMYLIKVALMAWALGMVIGYCFFCWIRKAGNKLDHNSSSIQITLTVCCAYGSYILSEGVFGLSGVLATVASSLVLAHHMWPHVVCADSMHHVWHTFESLGNTIVFFLAGALVGNCALQVELIAYVYLFVIYCVLMIFRGCLIFASRPLLRILSKNKEEVSWEDALVMTWGGLRGAVGLALAIQVYNEKVPDKNGNPQITDEEARYVLFFVGGIAFLTMAVNATTAPRLVHWLGITAVPRARMKLVQALCEQLVDWTTKEMVPENVTSGLRHMVDEIQAGLDATDTTEKLRKLTESDMMDADAVRNGLAGTDYKRKRGNMSSRLPAQWNCDLVDELKDCQEQHADKAVSDLSVLNKITEETMLGEVDNIMELVGKCQIDCNMAQAVNSAFLSIVRSEYWHMIEEQDLQPGSEATEVLLMSIQTALSPPGPDLHDLDEIKEHLLTRKTNDVIRMSQVFHETFVNSGTQNLEESPPHFLEVIINSSGFNIIVAIAICFSGVFVLAEETFRDDTQASLAYAWLCAECFFWLLFFLEFVVTALALRLDYFLDAWHSFDFLLVVVGFVGIVVSFVQLKEGHMDSSAARIVRVALAFRVLRLLRLFRLLEFFMKLTVDKSVSAEGAKRIHTMTVLDAFIRAHLLAQVSLVKFFGGNGEIDEASEADMGRCILQSQVQVYRAIEMARVEEATMDPLVLEEMRSAHRRKDITETLETFVADAYKRGAISGREAESILHPLNKEIQRCLLCIKDASLGKEIKKSIKDPIGLSNDDEVVSMQREECGDDQAPKDARQVSNDGFTRIASKLSDAESQRIASKFSDAESAATPLAGFEKAKNIMPGQPSFGDVLDSK
jgi:sodium/hydrogen exchanger 10/11